VRKLIRRLLKEGIYRVVKHAREEMEKDGLTDVDAKFVLGQGVVQPAEWENGQWRHRAEVHGNPGMRFVAAFDEEFDDVMPADDDDVSTKTITVVTGMKLKS
jgi:hypothetical protein